MILHSNYVLGGILEEFILHKHLKPIVHTEQHLHVSLNLLITFSKKELILISRQSQFLTQRFIRENNYYPCGLNACMRIFLMMCYPLLARYALWWYIFCFVWTHSAQIIKLFSKSKTDKVKNIKTHGICPFKIFHSA